ncbi:2-C-methyl-D-erythritol 4-phosphate cytidylyltransferase [Corynebacterium doosanense]|uniref:2-C-methyl-D-erythritol 4-phosphate cytidylyltransferase n=1 Tax=Corynebacterium doosanense CAU 212 = DSM 45436 TaxID=558173 RepID=A0A097II67_9CORY|nr:2-C-methyl-D-erythritol 4-phosphate cytidylyltransferase [Corynebacterium doosanense]AIT61827.1 2-C-methyl-D-erythritol 4-phosphate cytidylyltransferase [Corynebacterium doosanense CAU 212 = DSM 45436]
MGRPVIALVAAAGRGTRLGAETPKAFVPLRDRTLLERSVEAMIATGCVDEVIVLVSPDMEGDAAAVLGRSGLDRAQIPVRLVHGGGERADSIWAGLQAIGEDDAVVLVHDAARALTPPAMIARVARAVLEGSPAVIPVLPVSDTIKRVAGQTVVDTPDRAGLRAVQTPQGFDLAALREANRAYFTEAQQSFVATDDASLMEWHGAEVTCVPGDALAFKVTTPIDLTLATAIIDQAEHTPRKADS